MHAYLPQGINAVVKIGPALCYAGMMCRTTIDAAESAATVALGQLVRSSSFLSLLISWFSPMECHVPFSSAPCLASWDYWPCLFRFIASSNFCMVKCCTILMPVHFFHLAPKTGRSRENLPSTAHRFTSNAVLSSSRQPESACLHGAEPRPVTQATDGTIRFFLRLSSSSIPGSSWAANHVPYASAGTP